MNERRHPNFYGGDVEISRRAAAEVIATRARNSTTYTNCGFFLAAAKAGMTRDQVMRLLGNFVSATYGHCGDVNRLLHERVWIWDEWAKMLSQRSGLNLNEFAASKVDEAFNGIPGLVARTEHVASALGLDLFDLMSEVIHSPKSFKGNVSKALEAQ